jgi:hypothetical protein
LEREAFDDRYEHGDDRTRQGAVFECPGIEPVHWGRTYDGDPARVVDLRYRPIR